MLLRHRLLAPSSLLAAALSLGSLPFLTGCKSSDSDTPGVGHVQGATLSGQRVMKVGKLPLNSTVTPGQVRVYDVTTDRAVMPLTPVTGSVIIMLDKEKGVMMNQQTVVPGPLDPTDLYEIWWMQ